MTITTQQSVTAPNCGYPGDWYNTAVINQGLVQGGTATGGGVRVGTFCWGVSGTNNVSQLKGSNTQLGGFVLRAQNTTIAWAEITAGASMLIPDGQTVNFVPKGTFIAAVTSLNAGGTVAPKDKVYTKDSDGSVCVSTAAAGAGYTDTGWIVTKTNPGSVNYSGLAVVISNEQSFN